MTTLLVVGLVTLCVVSVALALRRGSGDSPAYRRRLPPHPRFRPRVEPAADNSTAVWLPLTITATTPAHHGIDPGCTVAGHSGVDCGSAGGADGG